MVRWNVQKGKGARLYDGDRVGRGPYVYNKEDMTKKKKKMQQNDTHGKKKKKMRKRKSKSVFYPRVLLVAPPPPLWDKGGTALCSVENVPLCMDLCASAFIHE
jgi:hypothetical protein